MNEHGLFNVFVQPRSVDALAATFDPRSGCIVLERHYPFDSRWRELMLPLDQATSSEPQPLTVRNVEFDVALTVEQFLSRRWNGPVYAWQCRTASPPTISVGREKRGTGAPLVAAMKGIGIDLLIESPGAGDVSMLASHEEPLLQTALQRFLGSQGPTVSAT